MFLERQSSILEWFLKKCVMAADISALSSINKLQKWYKINVNKTFSIVIIFHNITVLLHCWSNKMLLCCFFLTFKKITPNPQLKGFGSVWVLLFFVQGFTDTSLPSSGSCLTCLVSVRLWTLSWPRLWSSPQHLHNAPHYHSQGVKGKECQHLLHLIIWILIAIIHLHVQIYF